MIYRRMPENFDSKFEAVGCFIQCNGEIILLHRQPHKPQGATWGIPSGKIHFGENVLETVLRETKEETGLIIPRSNMLFFLTVYVKFPDYDFIYHIFHANIDKKAEIKINANEHDDAKWVSPSQALRLPLIKDLDSCMELFFAI